MWSQEQSWVQCKDTLLLCICIYIKTQTCFVQAENKPLVQKQASKTSWLFPAPDKAVTEQAWFNSSPVVAMPDWLERIWSNFWAL